MRDKTKGLPLIHKRFAALHARGVQINKVCVARELAGFVWAVGTQAQRESAKTA